MIFAIFLLGIWDIFSKYLKGYGILQGLMTKCSLNILRYNVKTGLKPHSHCADVATVHPDAGQPVYRDARGHIS